MKLIANIFFMALLTVFAFSAPVFSSVDSLQQYYGLNERLRPAFEREKDETHFKNITDIADQIDKTYSDLYNKLKAGGKITVFFDPAHGRLENGRLEGEVTGRLSSTGLPEEYYSMQFARKLYKLLSGNKYIRVISGDDYMRVLSGESDEYRKRSFRETVKSAKYENAFIMVTEHLNNISSLLKTDGLANISGIHVTLDNAGNRYLSYIKDTHRGYLTLYNKLDLSGLSRSIAYKIKEDLSSKGIALNSWDYGAVADDRFSYFIDFPVSVIFEQGFICNPAEEEKLRDSEYQQKIVESQYNAFIDSIKDIFGVDISGFWLKQTKENPDILDLLKLSRIAVYYLREDLPGKAVNTIDDICEGFFNSYFDLIEPYIKIKERITRSEEYFRISQTALKANQMKKARNYLFKAGEITAGDPVLAAMKGRYSQYGRKNFSLGNIEFIQKETYQKILLPDSVKKAARDTSVIFAKEKGQTLEDAIEKAFSPDLETAGRLLNAFNDTYVRKKIKVENYSEKKKKTVTSWKWEKEKADFSEGIYIIKVTKNWKIADIKKVTRVLLDPGKYQNQQYLKNSYFAQTTKEKSL